jgi:hypothetical protein
MAKVTDNNIVLVETEKIIFPNSQLSEDSTGTLIVSNADASKIQGITVDDSAIGDGKVLAYDQGSNTIKYVPGAGGGGATIKGIQYGIITVLNGNTSGTATVDEITMSNSLLLFNGFRTGNDVAGGEIRIELTNSTTVTAYRVGNNSNDCYAYFCLIEFDNGTIAGSQRGTITLTNPELTDTATINEVDTSKTIISYLGVTGTGSANDTRTGIELTNSTTVTAQRNQVAGSTVVGFEVLEFN